MRARLALAAVLAAGTLGACAAGGAATGDGGRAGDRTATTPTPYKITVTGDSISIGLGAAIRDLGRPGADVKVIGEEGTGLARPDRFDWPARLERLAREFPPRVLVLSLSSNDTQDLRDTAGTVVAKVGTPAWDTEYRRRLDRAFDAFGPGPATRVVWVGHVATGDPKVAATNRHVHQLATAAASGRPWVEVADLAALLGTGEQPATRCLQPDGLHLTPACLGEAAAALAPRLGP